MTTQHTNDHDHDRMDGTSVQLVDSMTIIRITTDGGAIAKLDSDGSGAYLSRGTVLRFDLQPGDRLNGTLVPNAQEGATTKWFGRRVSRRPEAIPDQLVSKVEDLLAEGAVWTPDEVARTLSNGSTSVREESYIISALEHLFNARRAAKAVVMHIKRPPEVYYAAPGRLVIERA